MLSWVRLGVFLFTGVRNSLVESEVSRQQESLVNSLYRQSSKMPVVSWESHASARMGRLDLFDGLTVTEDRREEVSAPYYKLGGKGI